MSKSYWLKDQKGNFSNEQEENEQEDTFDPEKRYIGIRLQQGVPLLDRDWNELEDIRRYEELMLRKWYVGNGTPDDGFKICAAGPPARNDFKIAAGRCLVDGFDVVNDRDILYTQQKGVKNPLSCGTNGVDTVYLDVWIEEVRSAEDPALKNSKDVNIETCVRHKLAWQVKVSEGSAVYLKDLPFHHYYDIARITREAGRDTILDTDIEDLRTTWLAVDLIQNRFKGVINTILKGNLPSDPEVQLVVLEKITGEGYPLSFEDTKGNIWLFWYAGNNIWCKTYRAGRWKADTQLTRGETNKHNRNAFEDAHGNIWLFWAAGNIIWCKTYRAGRWGEETQLTSAGTDYSYYRNAFGDAQGNIWLFWAAGTIIWCKTYRAGRWGEETQLTSAGTDSYYKNAFGDAQGNIWLFWYAGAGNNIWCKTYRADSWGEEETQLTSDETNKIYLNAFEDAHGNIWLFWYAGGIIWCKTYRADSWGEKETQLTTVEVSMAYRNAFGDAQGNIWLFWYADNNIWCKKTYADSWAYNTPLITGAEIYLTDIKLFEDHEGSIWLLFHKPIYGNIWCKRYVDGDWLAEMRLCSGRTMKPFYDSFEDHEGNIWLFWEEKTQTARSIWCKKCYASL